MENARIAAVLARIAELLQVKGEIRFKIQAYERAARVVESHPRPLAELYAQGGLKTLCGLAGIGEGIAKKIEELLVSGRCREYEKIKSELPPGIEELLDVPYLGPKTAVLLATKLKLKNVADLERALKAGKVRSLPRMGVKQEEKLLHGIALLRQARARMPLGLALPMAGKMLEFLRKIPGVARAEWAGSLRRMRETVGDFDFLASPADAREAAGIMEAFSRMPQVAQVMAKGETKTSVRLKSGLDADLRIVPEDSFGAALHYFTGSKAHNIQIREMGVKRGLKINEYGVFKGRRQIGGAEEEDVFRAVKVPFIPPELREGSGEIESALAGRVPRLVEFEDLRGDLHAHSEFSDGMQSIEEMALKARSLGYEYLGLCDHSQSLRLAGGLGVPELKKKNREIDSLNRRLRGVKVLKGAEVDILPDGSLDYPDKVLEELDVVIVAVHSRFRLDEDAQTRRICRALAHPKAHILAHPTGRLLGQREGYAVNLKQVVAAAKANGKCLELNSQPERMDLPDVWLRAAKEARVPVAIDTDAHDANYLEPGLRFGVGLARRGGLEPKDILNAADLAGLLGKLK